MEDGNYDHSATAAHHTTPRFFYLLFRERHEEEGTTVPAKRVNRFKTA